MGKIICPHCGNKLSETATSCPCGIDLEDMDIPAPGIVRSSTEENPPVEASPQPPKLQEIARRAPARKKEIEASPPARPSERADEITPARASKPVAAAPPIQPSKETASRPNKALLMHCPSCKAQISKRAQKCPKCSASPYGCCQVCDSRILANSEACPECGDPEPFLFTATHRQGYRTD